MCTYTHVYNMYTILCILYVYNMCIYVRTHMYIMYTYINIYVYVFLFMCMVHVCCRGTHVEVRGQFSGVSYTLLSLRVLGIERRLSSLTATLLCFLWLHGNWTRQCNPESLSSASVECESHPCCWLIVQHCTHIYFMTDSLLCSSLSIFVAGCCGFRLLADIHVGCVWCSAIRPACSTWAQQALLWPPAPSMLSLLHPDQSGGTVVHLMCISIFSRLTRCPPPWTSVYPVKTLCLYLVTGLIFLIIIDT